MTVDEIFNNVDIDNLTEDVDQTQWKRNLIKFLILSVIILLIWLLFFKPIKYTLPVSIEKSGTIPSSQTFSFVVSDSKGNVIKSAETNGNACEFVLKIKPISTRVYTIKQIGGALEDINYDYSVYTVRVIGIIGIIKPNIKITSSSGEANEIKFTNSFNEVGSRVYIPIIRVTANVDFPVTYALFDEDGTQVSTSTLKEDGSSTIHVSIKEEGVYHYKLKDITEAENYTPADEFDIVLEGVYNGKQFDITYKVYQDGKEQDNILLLSTKNVVF